MLPVSLCYIQLQLLYVITSVVMCTLYLVKILSSTLLVMLLIQDESAARAKEDDDRRKEVAAKFQVQRQFPLENN